MSNTFRYRFIIVALFTLLHVVGFSQNTVDSIVATYPAKFTSYQELTNRIATDFSGDEERARAAFAWIAMNVAYDLKGINNTQKVQFSYTSKEDLQAQKEAFRKKLASQVLKKKRALCEGYATLYQEICKLLNIECVIVTGIAKRFSSEIGKANLPSNHAWNAVKINKKWKLVDITWAAGSVDFAKMIFRKAYTPAYFACSPEEFAFKHYPDDLNYLFLNKAFSKEDFSLQPTVFNPFIGHGYRIISPKNGSLALKKGSDISFNITNVSSKTQISYHFSNEKYAQNIQVSQNEKGISFAIPALKKGKRELTIYFDQQAVLSYLVDIR
ncbi:transglutaminase domain-containing protein [Labilibaculum sp.]|uniref:transglutaminase domain-containing protein n=1 Tax=Labilibaculum sp. TaxID=2060723 RepID=UPI00356A515D